MRTRQGKKMGKGGQRVKCLHCQHIHKRSYGADGILVKPCRKCGGPVTYATKYPGDQPVAAEIESKPPRI